jgi:hypothetical protein
MSEYRPSIERQADIDTGYDYSFERKWGRFERVVWVFFVLLLALGMAGFFGRGPLNNVKRSLPDGASVQYERVVRFKSPSVLIFHLPVTNGWAKLEASTNAVKKAGLQQIVPTPTQDLGSEQVGPIQFHVADQKAKTVFVELAMQPSGIGPVTSRYSINGDTTVELHQFVLP